MHHIIELNEALAWYFRVVELMGAESEEAKTAWRDYCTLADEPEQYEDVLF